jgi:Tfp pilus assembly protein PilF
MTTLAEIRQERGAVAEAETLFAGAVERMRISETDTSRRPRDARAMIGIGRCRLAAGDAAGAERYFREALELERQFRRASHPDVARAETALASALIARGDAAGARALLQSAETALSTLVVETQVDRREARRLLAACR